MASTANTLDGDDQLGLFVGIRLSPIGLQAIYEETELSTASSALMLRVLRPVLQRSQAGRNGQHSQHAGR